MLTGIFLFLVFLAMAILMFFRKLPVLVALPFMAIGISLIGGIPLGETMTLVVGRGSLRLAEAYTVTLFGGMLSFFLQRSGIAESFIKKGAELSGDDPWKVGLVMLILIIVLFTTLGGLGAIIMVATIVLPIMASVGMTPMIAGGIFLIGLSTGGILNAGNWAVYIGVLRLDVVTVRNYAIVLFILSFIAALVFMTTELWRARQIKSLRKYVLRGGIGVISIVLLSLAAMSISDSRVREYAATAVNGIGVAVQILLATIALITVFAIIRDLARNRQDIPTKGEIRWYAYFVPVLPLVLILVYQVNFVTAFFIALVYGYLVTYRKGSLNLMTQAIIEGSASVMPAVILMLGIGMVLNAIIGPNDYGQTHAGLEWPVTSYLRPLISGILPSSSAGYVIVFTIAAPLALYRGPLNVWGLGYGLAAVMMATGNISGALVMAMLMSVGQVQGVCDPTNTQNVWIANELKLDVQAILWRTLPYMWCLAFLGLVTAAFMFY